MHRPPATDAKIYSPEQRDHLTSPHHRHKYFHALAIASMGAEVACCTQACLYFYYSTRAQQAAFTFTGGCLTLTEGGWRALVETVFLVRVGHRVKAPRPRRSRQAPGPKKGTVSGGPCRRRPPTSGLGPALSAHLVSRPSICSPLWVPIDLSDQAGSQHCFAAMWAA